ncbi:MAG: hypothetical protein ACLFT5_07925 [Desulfovermiculus sp.]
MQTETVQQFYEAVYKNKDTRNRLEEIAEKYLANNPDLDARIHVVNTHIIPMAQELGYDISIDDIRQYEEEMAKALNITAICSSNIEGVPQKEIAASSSLRFALGRPQ